MYEETKFVLLEYVIDPAGDYVKSMKFFDSLSESKYNFWKKALKECKENSILDEIEDLRDRGYTDMEILDKLYELKEQEKIGFFLPTDLLVWYKSFINFVKQNIENETGKKCTEIYELYGFSNIYKNTEYFSGTIIALFGVVLSEE